MFLWPSLFDELLESWCDFERHFNGGSALRPFRLCSYSIKANQSVFDRGLPQPKMEPEVERLSEQ